MKTKFCDSDWNARPFATAGRIFAVLALIFCVGTPLMNDLPNRWTFLFGGFGYSALLAFLTTGILLLPRHIRARIFLAQYIVMGCGVLIPAVILAILHFGLPLSIIHRSLPPLLWITGVCLGCMFAFAGYGWYHRFAHARTKVA